MKTQFSLLGSLVSWQLPCRNLVVTGLAEVDLASISGFNLGSELLCLIVARFAWILGLAHLLPVYLFL